LPKSYIVRKWAVFALGTLALFALQYLLLDRVALWGLRPFLYPMLPAVLSSYEGMRRGSVFSLALGVVCDLLLVGPFDGFFTLIFTVIGVGSGLIGEHLLPPGWLCGLSVSAMALLLTGLCRILVQLFRGGEHLLLMGRIAVVEALLSLPALLVVLPLYRLIHRRCAVDY